MQRLPTLVFDNVNSGDLDKIFLNANVQIKDDSALADGSGKPKYITVIDLTNLGGSISDIADLLAATTQWVTIGGDPEQGGVLHTTGLSYAVGDMVNLSGSSFIYVCKTGHTSTVDCDTAPDDANWYQPPAPGYSPTEYNYTSDLLGTGNGPNDFTVDAGSAGKTATVWLEGYELRSDEYTTAVDGIVTIHSAVSDNSWVKISI